MTKTEIELNRQQAIEDMKNLKESVNKTLDTVELSELGLKHNARVYSVNQLITISSYLTIFRIVCLMTTMRKFCGNWQKNT